ncbi:MAG: hypothetical protein MZV65_40475 [Chromatiales bacterium]|nr:hypothetical protein [Chromatiales bacterium]
MVDSMPRPVELPARHLLPRCCRLSEAEEIAFDVRDGSRRDGAVRLAARSRARSSRPSGFRTEKFKPAYLKLKGVLDSERPLKRAMGETIGGPLTDGLPGWI